MNLINDCISQGDYDFIRHCLVKNLQLLKVMAYGYTGYVGRIYSLPSYYQCSMELLDPHVYEQLFNLTKSKVIYTKVKDEPPARYARTSVVANSLIASGCIIEGTVENSILFRGVRVRPGSIVKNSVIMQQSEISEGVMLDGVICDKYVNISKGKIIVGQPTYPIVVKKGAIV